MKAYHFLKENMCGGYGSEPAWKIGEEREIKDGDITLCERGYHSSPSWYDALYYARGNMACIVEVSKPIQKDNTKSVSRKRKLMAAQNTEWALREWACDCATRILKKAIVKDERSWNAIRVARLYNKGEATKSELAAASDAARAAAWAASAAASDAASDAAWDAWDAARAAARAAAWAASDAARAAVWAASDAARAAETRWQKRRFNWYMKKLFQGKDKGGTDNG